MKYPGLSWVGLARLDRRDRARSIHVGVVATFAAPVTRRRGASIPRFAPDIATQKTAQSVKYCAIGAIIADPADQSKSQLAFWVATRKTVAPAL